MGRPLLGVLLAAALAVLAGCGSAPPVEYAYQPPEQTDDGLPVGTLDEVGIDPDLLGRAVDEIRDGRCGEVHSLLLYTDGRLVLRSTSRATTTSGTPRLPGRVDRLGPEHPAQRALGRQQPHLGLYRDRHR